MAEPTSLNSNFESAKALSCPHCRTTFALGQPNRNARFCPSCGNLIYSSQTEQSSYREEEARPAEKRDTLLALLPGQHPTSDQIQSYIGPYAILNSIGKGGMGEVLLAYDTECGRKIALKKIRDDLIGHHPIQRRFLKEAHITSQLTHPAIIPIYEIHEEAEQVYYTMPFVEGETLKQIVRSCRGQQKRGDKIDHPHGSIPALLSIFLTVCQAVAYAHAKGVLHRDLKPENIIIGRYGEVMILDWGLAKLLREKSVDDEHSIEHQDDVRSLTNLGKVVGTIAYMAPERALGQPATYQTDIYSLGVILYQLLTLQLPFKRGTLKEFLQKMAHEVLHDPTEIAPYRDVPPLLAQIAMKALSTQLDKRYHSVDDLIDDLKNYIEGRSEWFQIAKLDIHNKEDWEFQEHVLIAEHVAITRGIEMSDWVNLMISRASFNQNTRLEARVRIGERGHGIGFLLSIPEVAERTHLNDGYCLWLGSDLAPTTKLLRSTVEVIHAPEILLRRGEWYHVSIEKIDQHLYFRLNGQLQLTYISHLPLMGTHVGLLARDADYELEDLYVSLGNQNLTVSCLAIPDAFLAQKDYVTALAEYRRIGYSFPGRAEGREAMFRAGITLLEQAKSCGTFAKRAPLYDLALEEFEKQYNTSGAPLEYLGKALVYQAQQEEEEEIKCFELAFRRYPRHPLLPIIEEHVLYRLHESSRHSRRATYRFMLLTLHHLPHLATGHQTQKLLKSLETHWETLSFISPMQDPAKERYPHDSLLLAFWLAQPLGIEELIHSFATQASPPLNLLGDAIYGLIELGIPRFAQNQLMLLRRKKWPEEYKGASIKLFAILDVALKSAENPEEACSLFNAMAPSQLGFEEERLLRLIIESALDQYNFELIKLIPQMLEGRHQSAELALTLDCALIWTALIAGEFSEAARLFSRYPLELLNQESTALHSLYGCWLLLTEGREIADIHFHGAIETLYPRSWSLLSHYLNGQVKEESSWFKHSLLWERRQLWRQLSLFYQATGELERAQTYHTKLLKEIPDVSFTTA